LIETEKEISIMSEDRVMIHVRFAPNGGVTEIGERPASLSAQDWFNLLSDNAGMSYQALSGGRGLFRLTRERTDTLKSGAAH
jgi:hypothetical protein